MTNFINEDVTISIFDIRIIGRCKKLNGDPNDLYNTEEVKIALNKVVFDSDEINTSIKEDTIDFNVQKGASVSFWFSYTKPTLTCEVSLVLSYTNPLNGERATFQERLNIK